jgi:hypothetical protein
MKWWLLLVLGVLCGEYGWSCRVRIWIQDGNSRLYLMWRLWCWQMTPSTVYTEANQRGLWIISYTVLNHISYRALSSWAPSSMALRSQDLAQSQLAHCVGHCTTWLHFCNQHTSSHILFGPFGFSASWVLTSIGQRILECSLLLDLKYLWV